MINLIPQEYKNKALGYKKWQNVFKIQINIIILLLVLFIGLFVMDFYFSASKDYQESMLDVVKTLSPKADLIRGEVVSLNKDVEYAIGVLGNQISVIDIFDKIAINLLKGMYIQSIAVSNKEELLISIVGYAPDNDTLLEFRDILEEEFETEINIPLKALTKRQDIDFSIRFEIK